MFPSFSLVRPKTKRNICKNQKSLPHVPSLTSQRVSETSSHTSSVFSLHSCNKKNHSNSKIISKDLDEDSLASLCLLLHPLHRLVGGDVHTKFLEMVKMAMISCQHKILDGDDNMQTIIIINSPCCGDLHSPLPLLMAIHTWLGRCCCLSLTMMVAGSVMSMTTNNDHF